jgi:Flp pilus assembly protein CpaB
MNRKRRPRRLRRKTNTLVVFLSTSGLVLGIAALFITMQPRQVESDDIQNKVVIASDYDTVLVPTPTRTIARGEILGNVTFSTVRWPKHRLTENYILDIEPYMNATSLAVLPKYLPIPISAITTEVVDSNAVVDGIPEGMRAITVRVDEESSVEGWARSGNFVDVIMIRSSANDVLGLETKVIAENVKILSAERESTPSRGGSVAQKAPRTVTLLTTQEDALKVKTAGSIGKLTFALRGSGDQSPTLSTAMNQRKLLGQPRADTTRANFRGFAKGPNGEMYVLSQEANRWLQSPELTGEVPLGFLKSPRNEMQFDEGGQ